jgi:hypothetical protein
MAKPLPDLLYNAGTWAVPICELPSLAIKLMAAYPAEEFDPDFEGQGLCTNYYDTLNYDLRKARNKGDRYMTLRIRSYRPLGVVAVSAKTEKAKYRKVLNVNEQPSYGTAIPFADWASLLPPDLFSRLYELAGEADLYPVVKVDCTRYAVENDMERFTLDVDVRTDLAKRMKYAVLEYKTTDPGTHQPAFPINFHPIKLSKFLWATR